MAAAHGGSTRLQIDDDVVDSAASPSRPETNAPDETIEKLRLANQALRQQLKEFSRALDASLADNTGEELSSAKSPAHGRRRNMLQALGAKEKQLKAVHKKLEIYKRANVELKKQLGSVYQPEKLQQLKSEKREKERIIRELKDENKSLLIVQRNQTKKIEEQENLKHEWPSKVSSLMQDLRVAKDKLRKAKERESRVEQDSRKLHENMVKLQQKNKRLQQHLAEYERGGGRGGNRAKSKMMAEWKAEKAKLEHSIQVLEKSKQQQRTKGERLLRANMKELEKVKQEMERHKGQLNEKEKEIRLQVLQVKKLRRQLRELALGGGGGGGGGAGSGSSGGIRDGWDGGADSGGVGASSPGARSVRRKPGRGPSHLTPVSGSGSRDAGNTRRARSGARGGARGGGAAGGPGGRRLGKAPLGSRRSNTGNSKGKESEDVAAALQIQSLYRGAKVRKDIKKQHDAAARVQRIYRGHSARKLVRSKHEAATKVQSVFRGHRTRKSGKPLNRDQAATKIQAAARGRAARRNVGGVVGRGYGAAARQDEEDGAVALQSVYRGHRGRKRYKAVREEKDGAARRIQAVARGYNGRVAVRRVKGERARERARRFAAASNRNNQLQRSRSGNRILRPAGSRRNVFAAAKK